MQLPSIPVIDSVGSYLGMRKISLNRTSPTNPLRIFLNNKATLQLGLLDQVKSPFDFCIPIHPGSLQPFLYLLLHQRRHTEQLAALCASVADCSAGTSKEITICKAAQACQSLPLRCSPAAEIQLQLQAIAEALP